MTMLSACLSDYFNTPYGGDERRRRSEKLEVKEQSCDTVLFPMFVVISWATAKNVFRTGGRGGGE